MRNLLTYLPELYHDIKEFAELTGTEDTDFEVMAAAVQRLLDDQFVDSASEQAIKRWELQLGIRADNSVETLEFRRKRLINRYSTKPPFSIRYLQNRLDVLVGTGLATVEVDIQNFILKVSINVPDAAYFKEIEHTIKSVKPANLVYNQATSLDGSIGFEEHITRTPLIRMTRLGTGWRLGSTPFASRGQEVQIK